MNKYRARKTTIDGITFDSKGEGRRYEFLKMAEAAGAISELTLQPEYVLVPSFKYQEKTIRAIKYRADFAYCVGQQRVVEDFKGVETPVFKLKSKLFKKWLVENGRGIVFRVVKEALSPIDK